MNEPARPSAPGARYQSSRSLTVLVPSRFSPGLEPNGFISPQLSLVSIKTGVASSISSLFARVTQSRLPSPDSFGPGAPRILPPAGLGDAFTDVPRRPARVRGSHSQRLRRWGFAPPTRRRPGRLRAPLVTSRLLPGPHSFSPSGMAGSGES